MANKLDVATARNGNGRLGTVTLGALGVLLASAGLAGCGSPGTTTATDMSMAVQMSCCGKPGDPGNSLGVGKYCTDPTGSECVKNSMATICSSIEDTPARKTTFCTMQCNPNTPNFCGENASCTLDSISKAYGCTPNACTTNLPPGCSA